MLCKSVACLVLGGLLVHVPSATSQTEVREIRRVETRAGGTYVGVGIIDISDEAAKEIGLVNPHGIEVLGVRPNSPADEAGLREGDYILSYRGEEVQGVAHFSRLVNETRAGRQVELGVVRDGDRMSITVEVGLRPANRTMEDAVERIGSLPEELAERLRGAQFKLRLEGRLDEDLADKFDAHLNLPRVHVNTWSRLLGAELEDIEGPFARFLGVREGVLVREVREGSPTAATLRAGDVIVGLNGQPVSRASRLVRTLSSLDGDEVELEITRERTSTTVEVQLRKRDAAPSP